MKPINSHTHKKIAKQPISYSLKKLNFPEFLNFNEQTKLLRNKNKKYIRFL